MSAAANPREDPRVDDILETIAQLSCGNLGYRATPSGKQDGLDQIIEQLNQLANELADGQNFRSEDNQRLEQTLDAIVAIASLDFSKKAPVGDEGDVFDAVAVGLNALGEELLASTVSKEYLDNIIHSMVDSLVVVDLMANIQTVNQAALDLLGYTQQELIGQPLAAIFAPGALDAAGFDEIIETGTIKKVETTYCTKDGTLVPVSFSGSLMSDERDRPSRIVCVAQDSTERVRAQNELREAHQLLETIFDHTHIMVAYMDSQFNFIKVNRAYAEVDGGKHPDYFPGKNHFTLYPNEENKAIFTRVVETKEPYITFAKPFEYVDGGILGVTYWDWTLIPLLNPQGAVDGLLLTLLDVTDRVTASHALRESETKARTLINAPSDSIMLIDSQGIILEINENGAQRMGKTVDQLIGTDVFSYLPIDLAASRRKKLDTVFAAAEPAIFEDQREGMYFTNAIYPIINMNGQVSSVAVYARDITARVLAEEKILASLHEKEFLLKEIHHRVKNNLQIISSLIHLQSKKITDEQTLTILKESQNRVKSMALIHEKLYQSSDFTQIDFADYIRSLAGHLFRTYQVNSNDISYEIFAEDVSLTIDLAIPCGVIINELVSNTLKHAFPGDMGGKITISLREASPNTLQLEITDTGVGFPKDIDFRKTDSLGLQLVNNLVEQLHGDIQLDSQAGSKFIITFEKYTEK